MIHLKNLGITPPSISFHMNTLLHSDTQPAIKALSVP